MFNAEINEGDYIVDAAVVVGELVKWQESLDVTDVEDSIIYSTLEAVYDIIYDNAVEV